ncbi:MAG: uracil-DNA glycosylase [Thermoanaerobaculaceae bacterium]|jgi:uracil-DNA glycosylase family 4|nr:uracil-DNA glycosylase [Thermoanaerobaculaceae bacterium]
MGRAARDAGGRITGADLLRYLRDLGWRDVAWQPPPAKAVPPPVAHASSTPPAALDPSRAESLEEMARSLADCRRCRLAGSRSRVVFGAGSNRARVLFVGEGPGAEEDRQGVPFVGKAGQLLNAMLRAVGLRREDVYIANVVKCRPPENRDPQEDEAAACLPFLWRQIELVDPAVIVALGRVASQFLLGTKAPISSYRGRWTSCRGRDVLPTFHPAYLLRTPSAKAAVWADLKLLRQRLRDG